MGDFSIKVENIAKKYRLGINKSGSLRESFTQWISGPNDKSTEEFWALNDISFDIKKGDAIGIIGRNGAGKSTLLKILSRITEPTKGRFEINGRVASLLEIGTGFHPELTGRENIFLNGTILGMRRHEVKTRFDEIVEFSGVEKFIDTPVKHYSSGMYVRLAFAVAAHLEPEILIVDEVLAVGDAGFQRKCLGKMGEVSNEGRTVILVSHNMAHIQSLCNNGILLDGGQVVSKGNINNVVSDYMNEGSIQSVVDISQYQRVGVKSDEFQINELKIDSTSEGQLIFENDTIIFKIYFEITEPIEELVIGFSMTNVAQSNLIECQSTASLLKMNIDKIGVHMISVNFSPKLKAGFYNLNLGARCKKGMLEYIPSVATIEIQNKTQSRFENWNMPSSGALITKSIWTLN